MSDGLPITRSADRVSDEPAERPVLVTGAAGFVGAHVTRALLVAGRSVIATDLADQLPDRIIAGLPEPRLTYVAGDLTRDETITALLESSTGQLDLVHAAAVIAFNQLGASLGGRGPSAHDVLRSFTVNAQASWRLCAALADDGRSRRMVHVSTRAVFGGRPSGAASIGEAEPCQPAGVYGSSKAAAEMGVLALREQFGLDVVVARITGVYGPWQGPVSWIGQAVDAIVNERPYRTPAGADDGYELTYVKDTVRGLLALLTADTLAHRIYHVATGERLIELREVAETLRLVETTADVEFGPGHAAGAGRRTPLAIDRLAAETGFAPRWALRDALADYLAVERTGHYGVEVSLV
jgi:nucleoside-diphosphate-sugar epimerase